MDQLDGVVEFVLSKASIRSGFHLADASSLAGGPIEIEFSLELREPGACYLMVRADRMRQRPDGFDFTATLDRVTLDDPFANFPNMGGPAGVIEISAQQPWRQQLILNEFVRLERAVELLEPSATGRLDVICRRQLHLAADESAALKSAGEGRLVEVPLSLALQREDARLADLARELISQVRYGPREHRERPLALLLAMRAPVAVEQWRSLLDHSDPSVVERVRNALQLAARVRT